MRDFDEPPRMRGGVENPFRLAFEHAPIGIAIAALDGRWLHVNRALCDLVGYTSEELLHGGVNDITHPDDLSIQPRACEPLLRGESDRVQYEKRYVHRAGAEVWVQATVSLVRDAAGGPLCYIAQLQDVTERRRARARMVAASAAMRASEERFRALIENATELVCVIDAQARLLYVAPASLRTLGYDPGEMVGQSVFEFVALEERDAAGDTLRTILDRPGEVVRFEVRAQRRDGGTRTLECHARNLLDHPAVRGIIVNAHDITERVATLAALRTSEEQLRQSQKLEAIGRLAGGVAHDFNNILTTITGHSALILEEVDPREPLYADVTEIQRAAERGGGLTRQLLAFSRRQVLQTSILDLGHVVQDMERMLRRLIGEDVHFSVVRDPSSPHIVADRSQIEQVVLNLVVNARDAMPSGGRLTVRIASEELSAADVPAGSPLTPGPYARLSVRDTGSGIPSEHVGRIFDPFFTTKERGHGTGLGLATVYGIINQSGGHIGVCTEEGVGTTFHVLLPAVQPPAPNRGQPDTPAVAAHSGGMVLLVEDEDPVRHVAQRVLNRHGYEVLSARNAAEALVRFRSFADRIDLLLTDVIMPEMSGPELATQLRKLRPDLKVLFMSGYTDDAIASHGLNDSTIALLEKPFSPAALAARVREMIAASPD